MSTDDPDPPDENPEVEPADLRAELDRQRARRPEPNAEGVVDLLSAAFDTDRRTRVYVGLRRRPDSTAEDLAEETGLYPPTVDRVLSDLEAEGVVERHAGDGGRYTAVAPREAVDVALGRVRDEIDERFTPNRSRERTLSTGGSTEPVTIPVEKEPSDEDADDDLGETDPDDGPDE